MRFKLIIAIVVGLAIVLGIIFLSGPTVVDRPEKGSAVIAFGDSLVTGYGVNNPGR